ncbi:hypothetical protein HGI30_14940 [Paenibacillus albicereus]|uniref:Uncharacterized protein n=1 Tax=Paenibacillus albicereus TaxID=2726185 RepID=A0A6H2H048_9BACL|nr:hypothetical protein [Paenibacillus albicereus]QJC52728.1 hypothetical protein HGI30_14940 [Paenibacillus albicereus]
MKLYDKTRWLDGYATWQGKRKGVTVSVSQDKYRHNRWYWHVSEPFYYSSLRREEDGVGDPTFETKEQAAADAVNWINAKMKEGNT